MPLRSLHEGETGAPVVVVVLYRCPSRNWSNSGELILSSDCHRGPTRSAAQYTGCPVESCKSEARLVMATPGPKATRNLIDGCPFVLSVCMQASWKEGNRNPRFGYADGEAGFTPRSFTIGVPRRIHQWRRRLLNNDLLPKWTQCFGSVCCPQCALPFGSWCFHALMVFAVKTGVHAECCRHPLVRGPRVRARVLA